MDIDLNAGAVTIGKGGLRIEADSEYNFRTQIEVSLTDVDALDVYIEIQKDLTVDEILSYVDRSDAIKYFDIEEKED